MRYTLFILLFALTSLLFSAEGGLKKLSFEEQVYDPFFAATIQDNEGEEFIITRMAFYDEFNDEKYFFWVRRNSGLYNLSFKNIRSIKISEDDLADERYKNFTRCTLELVTGESYTLYLKTTGHLEGWDEAFASPVSFYLHYNLIRSITFHHEGEYDICSFCSTIYFNKDIDRCIYDKTPLIRGVLGDSKR